MKDTIKRTYYQPRIVAPRQVREDLPCRLTRDTLNSMSDVSARELRNHGAEVLNRVLAGECLTVTRAGRPVAELRPLPQPGIDAATLLERWKNLPAVDPDSFRRDIDEGAFHIVRS